MPFRQTIGISLALLMASTGAWAGAPERTSSYHPAPPPNAEPGGASNRSGKIRQSQKRTQSPMPGRRSPRHAARLWPRHSTLRETAADETFAEPQWGPMHVSGAPQIGEAAWYDLIGRRTADGERLDTETPTAAHRSLPLGSCAKVTDLDTGQSIIVKINDRGPFNRRFIIDLSPRAAQELGMHGTAAVAVEPVAPGGAAPRTDLVYRSSGAGATQ